MRRRVGAAAVGAGLASAVLVALLVTAAWRPTGTLLALGLLGVLVPAVAAGGVVSALRLAHAGEVAQVARLTALGTPVLVLVALFGVHAVAVDARPGAQQAAALVSGATVAAALAARFTGGDADMSMGGSACGGACCHVSCGSGAEPQDDADTDP
ncbi:MAG TPA: hypothetical protein VMM13_01815 [Euzebya sp.]|nr:hypothetical protein [Euzebya sp.]